MLKPSLIRAAFYLFWMVAGIATVVWDGNLGLSILGGTISAGALVMLIKTTCTSVSVIDQRVIIRDPMWRQREVIGEFLVLYNNALGIDNAKHIKLCDVARRSDHKQLKAMFDRAGVRCRMVEGNYDYARRPGY